MTPFCPLCQNPIVVVRAAVGAEDIVLHPEPMTVLRGNDPAFRVVVNGFAWAPVDIVAAIAIETSVSEQAAFMRAVQDLEWYRVHVCAAGLVPA